MVKVDYDQFTNTITLKTLLLSARNHTLKRRLTLIDKAAFGKLLTCRCRLVTFRDYHKVNQPHG